jgi:hypothetical protein
MSVFFPVLLEGFMSIPLVLILVLFVRVHVSNSVLPVGCLHDGRKFQKQVKTYLISHPLQACNMHAEGKVIFFDL